MFAREMWTINVGVLSLIDSSNINIAWACDIVLETCKSNWTVNNECISSKTIDTKRKGENNTAEPTIFINQTEPNHIY